MPYVLAHPPAIVQAHNQYYHKQQQDEQHYEKPNFPLFFIIWKCLKVSGSMVLDDLRPYRYHKIRYKTVHCNIDLHCDALRRIHYRTTKQVEQHVHSLVFE
ncbi:MAG: hypothetical protein ACLUVG_21245 [Phocaeicola vulgatus]